MRTFNRLADRVLARFMPRATAKADTSYMKWCYCYQGWSYRQRCEIVGGTTSCGPCQFMGMGC